MILRLLIYALLTALLFAGIYLVYLAFAAKQSVAGTPRKPVHLCDIHGPVPPLTLFDDMEYETGGANGVQRGPIYGCPICFENKIKKAKEHYKG